MLIHIHMVESPYLWCHSVVLQSFTEIVVYVAVTKYLIKATDGNRAFLLDHSSRYSVSCQQELEVGSH